MSELPGTAVAAAAHPEVEAIRSAGARAVAQRDEVRRYVKMIEGGEWTTGTGVVKGSALSPATRQMFAEFCIKAGANPYYHVDLLGGKPFLNEKYWSDRINSDPQFVEWRPVNISDSPTARAEWGIPAWAEAAYVVEIDKLANFAPLAKIRSGEITDWRAYVVTTREANYAGGKKAGKPDPVGNENPGKTARTRALRRTAAKAFPIWCSEEEERIRRLEDAVEAEFTVIATDFRAERAALPPADGPQALRVGAGEPMAAPLEAVQAQPLVAVPGDGRARNVRPGRGVRGEAVPVATDNDEAEFHAARIRYEQGCAVAGLDPVAFAREQELEPETAEDFVRLSAAVSAVLDGDDGRLL